MKVVIDIPENEYERLQRDAGWTNLELYRELVKNGQPLPKRHGRLIDADKAVEALHNHILDYLPTIIEADKGDEECNWTW